MRVNPALRTAALVSLIAVIALNGMAFFHARAMCRYTDSESKTRRPEELSVSAKLQVLVTGVDLPRPTNSQTPSDYGLAFDERVITGPNGSLEAWFLDAANPKAVVVAFHGYSASKEQLLPLAKPLLALDCNVVLVDFFGSGGSSGNTTSMGFTEAHDVVVTVDDVRARFPDLPIVLYGFSMGAAALLKAMHMHQVTADGLVIESAFDSLLGTTKNRFGMMGVPATPLAHCLLFWGGVYSGYNAFGFRPVDYAESVSCPTLVLHGALDERVTTDQVKRVYSRVSGWKRFAEYPDVGHALIGEAAPSSWKDDVGILLKQVHR